MIRKNVASQNIPFVLKNASSGLTLTGATCSGYITKDGGAVAALAGTFSEKGDGLYNYVPTQAETNANAFGIVITATGALPVDFTVITTAADPTDSERFGLLALPNANAGAAGGLPLSVDASGRVDMLKINGVTQGDIYGILNNGVYGNSAMLSSILAAIANIQNGVFVSATVPPVIENPLTGSQNKMIVMTFADETGIPHDLDSSALPTVYIQNDAGYNWTSYRITGLAHVATGTYICYYIATHGDAIESIHWNIYGTVATHARQLNAISQVVDSAAVSFTAADRTTLNAINAKTTNLPTDPASETNATANKNAINAHTDSDVAPLATETNATANKNTILAALPEDTSGLDAQILAIVSGGQTGGVRYVDFTAGLDTNDGLSWATPVKHINHAFSLMNSAYGSTVFAKSALYTDEDVVVPANCKLIGIDWPGSNAKVELFVVTATTNPVLTLSENAQAINVRVGCNSKPSGTQTLLLMLDGSKFLNSTMGGINGYFPYLITMSGGIGQEIGNCWIDGTSTPNPTVLIDCDQPEIHDTEFQNSLGDLFVIPSSTLHFSTTIVRNRFFIAAGRYILRAPSGSSIDSPNMSENLYSGGGQLTDGLNLVNPVIYNNDQWATDPDMKFVRRHFDGAQDIVELPAVGSGKYYLVTKDLTGTMIDKQYLTTYDNLDLENLAGTGTPSLRGQNLV